LAEDEAADTLTDSPVSSPIIDRTPSVSDKSDIPNKPIDSAEKLSLLQVAERERKSLLKTWLATVIGTAVAFALVSGIKDIRALVTTSMSAGSIAFVVSALGNSNGRS
jgi:hypothetical protein